MTAGRQTKIGGVIVAGGGATRMNGIEKPLRMLAGRPILERIVERVRPQVDELAIDVRASSRALYDSWPTQNVAILSDAFDGRAGPLAGVVGGLEWLNSLGGDFEWLATFPGDTPFLPHDLVRRLRALATVERPVPVVASDGEQVQNLCALWPVVCLSELRRGVQDGRVRSVRRALDELGAIQCPVSSQHVFTNINTERDLVDAERLIEQHSALT